MRKLITFVIALGLAVGFAPIAHTQSNPQVSVAGSASGVDGATSSVAMLVKYVGTTAGLPDVAVDATTGDLTFRLAAAAVTSFECPVSGDLGGIIDVSNAACDTFGEVVNIINASSDWRAVLVSALASDLTTDAMDTLSATDAATPLGVALRRDAEVASVSAVFSAQVALVPDDAATNIGFFLSGGSVGLPSGSTKVNPNPFARHQTFVQHIREKITSSGTVALFEVLAVKRTYSPTGQISETVRVLYGETGAATTVEKVVNFHPGPIVAAPGELVVVRQRTATALTAAQIAGNGYMVRR